MTKKLCHAPNVAFPYSERLVDCPLQPVLVSILHQPHRELSAAYRHAMVSGDHLVDVINYHDAPPSFDRDPLPRILLAIDIFEGYLIVLTHHRVEGYQSRYRSPVCISAKARTFLPDTHVLIYLLLHQEFTAPPYQVSLYRLGLLLSIGSV